MYFILDVICKLKLKFVERLVWNIKLIELNLYVYFAYKRVFFGDFDFEKYIELKLLKL